MKINKMSDVFNGDGIPRVADEETYEDDDKFSFDRKTIEMKQKLHPSNVSHSINMQRSRGGNVVGNILSSQSKNKANEYFNFEKKKKNPNIMVKGMLGGGNTMAKGMLGGGNTKVNPYLGGKTKTKNAVNPNDYLSMNIKSPLNKKVTSALGGFEGRMTNGLNMQTDVLGINRIKQQKGLPIFGDKDNDKVFNIFDCSPKNPKKQAFVHQFVQSMKDAPYQEGEGTVALPRAVADVQYDPEKDDSLLPPMGEETQRYAPAVGAIKTAGSTVGKFLTGAATKVKTLGQKDISPKQEAEAYEYKQLREQMSPVEYIKYAEDKKQRDLMQNIQADKARAEIEALRVRTDVLKAQTPSTVQRGFNKLTGDVAGGIKAFSTGVKRVGTKIPTQQIQRATSFAGPGKIDGDDRQKVMNLVGTGNTHGEWFQRMAGTGGSGAGYAVMAQPGQTGTGFYTTLATMTGQPKYVIEQQQATIETPGAIKPEMEMSQSEMPQSVNDVEEAKEGKEPATITFKEAYPAIPQTTPKQEGPTVIIREIEKPVQGFPLQQGLQQQYPMPQSTQQQYPMPQSTQQQYPRQTQTSYDGRSPSSQGMVWSELSKKWVRYPRGQYKKGRMG